MLFKYRAILTTEYMKEKPRGLEFSRIVRGGERKERIVGRDGGNLRGTFKEAFSFPYKGDALLETVG